MKNNPEKEFASQEQAARRAWTEKQPVHVKLVQFDAATEKILVELNSGASFTTLARHIEGLENASLEQLARVEVAPGGDGLRWDDLDVDIDVAALQLGIFGTKSWMARLGERGGRVSTPEKAEAARLNGQRGGRPPSLAKTFWDRLKQLGLPRAFVLERLLPPGLQEAFSVARGTKDKDALVPEMSEYIQHIFQWSLDDILSDRRLEFPQNAGGQARFKIPANSSEGRTAAYVVYAHYLALLTLQATAHLSPRTLEQTPEAVRNAILARSEDITLRSTLQYLWDYGVPVLPLRDAGVFHGACWRVEGRNVILLKQTSLSEARWLFDLLHEQKHSSEHPELSEFAVIEASEASVERRTSVEEQVASYHAGEIALRGQAEDLTALCVKRAGGSLERLKSAVQQVAREHHVSVDLLANYLAFRLSLQGENWWGAAANLQQVGQPYDLTRAFFLQHARLDTLNEVDRTLLDRALTPDQNA